MVKAKVEFDFLLETFKLIWAGKNHPLLQDWLEKEVLRLDEKSENILELFEPFIEKEIDGWLEEELKMKLISPILLLSNLNFPNKIGVFYERQISAKIDEYLVTVKADCMVSSVFGFTTPKHPYFFMQEFKKSKGDKQDPEGQMLAAMLAGQHLNNNGKPMYGSYVIGRDWFFSTLHGKEYAKSEALQLTQPAELRQVILTLRKLKQIILNDLAD
jgi:hypothetical protein